MSRRIPQGYLALARSLDQEADRLQQVTAEIGLCADLHIWAMTLRRLSRSASALARQSVAWVSGDRSAMPVFSELPAHLDLLTFLTIGDMVLDDLATVHLAHLARKRGEYPWTTLM